MNEIGMSEKKEEASNLNERLKEAAEIISDLLDAISLYDGCMSPELQDRAEDFVKDFSMLAADADTNG